MRSSHFNDIFLPDALIPAFTSHAFHITRPREFILSSPTGILTTPPRTPEFHLNCGLKIQAEEGRKGGTKVAGKLDHFYPLVKANECQLLSVSVSFSSRWKLEGRTSDWLSLVGGDQGILIDSPINAKGGSPKQNRMPLSREGGNTFHVGRQRAAQIHYNWEGSGHMPPKE